MYSEKIVPRKKVGIKLRDSLVFLIFQEIPSLHNPSDSLLFVQCFLLWTPCCNTFLLSHLWKCYWAFKKSICWTNILGWLYCPSILVQCCDFRPSLHDSVLTCDQICDFKFEKCERNILWSASVKIVKFNWKRF